MTYGELLKKYVLDINISPYLYECKDLLYEGDNWIKIDEGNRGIKANILGHYISWIFEGTYEARHLPRKKKKLLNVLVIRRIRNLKRFYKN